MDGHGTIGLEVMDDAPETETIYVPIGVGFLSAGIALATKALKPSVRVIGVNAKRLRILRESEAGQTRAREQYRSGPTI